MNKYRDEESSGDWIVLKRNNSFGHAGQQRWRNNQRKRKNVANKFTSGLRGLVWQKCTLLQRKKEITLCIQTACRPCQSNWSQNDLKSKSSVSWAFLAHLLAHISFWIFHMFIFLICTLDTNTKQWGSHIFCLWHRNCWQAYLGMAQISKSWGWMARPCL